MSESNTRFKVVVEDPPLLKALLLCAGDDPETIAVITRAYHGCLEGRSASPFVMSSVLLSAIGNAILHSAPSANGNGVSPGQLKSTQLEAIENSLKTLANRADLQAFHTELLKAIRAGEGENRELTAFLDDWRINEARKSSRKGMAVHWLIHIAVIAAIAAFVFAVGYFVCWTNIHAASDDRVDRIINAQPAAAQATAALAGHGGSITIGPISGPDGRQARGVIVRPGDLRQGMSTDGAVLLTLP